MKEGTDFFVLTKGDNNEYNRHSKNFTTQVPFLISG